MKRPIKQGMSAVLVVLALGCQSQEERLTEYAERANQYIENEEWGEAKIELLNMIQIDPENGEARFKLGDTLLQLKEYGDALWQYREAVRLQPDEFEWRVKLTSLQLRAGQLYDAQEQIEYVLEREPDRTDALLLNARLQGRRGEVEAMLASLTRLLEIEPDNIQGLLFKAQALANLQRFGEAEQTIDTMIETEPTMASYTLRAAFLVTRERYDEAEQAYRKAIEVSETPRERKAARLALANLYMSQKNLDGAEQELLAAREEAEGEDEFLNALARFYLMAKKPEKAEQILEERAARYPDRLGPLIGLARFQNLRGEREKAYATIERALEVDPTSGEARVLRAEFLLERSKTDPAAREEARQIVDAVLADNPASLRGQFTRAKILLTEGQHEEASALLRRVLEEQPDANSYFLLGTAYLAMGQEDLARAQFLSALQQNPVHVIARTQLAVLYLRSQNPEQAALEARRGLEVLPTDPRLLLVLAESQVQLRDAEKAEATLDRLTLEPEDVPPEIRLRAIRLYLELARLDKARAIVDAVLEKNPTDPGGLRAAILVEARAGEPGKALPRLNAAIEAEPENAELYRIRGSYFVGLRRPFDRTPRFPNEAQADLLQAQELEPDNDTTYLMIATLRQMTGNQTAALEALDRAIELNPANGAAYMLKGSLLELQQRYLEAVDTYRALLTRSDRGGVSQRSLAVAMNNLAWLLVDDENATPQDLDRALELAQDAKEFLPDEPNVADTLGWVMYKREIHGAAISLFREAIASYAPGSASRALTRYHLALSYEANGNPGRAIEELRLSLKEADSFPGRGEAEATLERLEAS